MPEGHVAIEDVDVTGLRQLASTLPYELAEDLWRYVLASEVPDLPEPWGCRAAEQVSSDASPGGVPGLSEPTEPDE